MSTEVLAKNVFRLLDGHWLLLRYWSKKDVTLDVRILYEDTDGNILQVVQSVQTDHSGQEKRVQWSLSPGWLLSAVVSISSGAALTSEIFCELSVCIVSDGNLIPIKVLFSDYVSSFQNLSWPESRITNPASIPGTVQSFYAAGPFSPGTSVQVDYRVTSRVLGIEFYLTADATPGDRYITLILSGAIGIGYQWQSTIAQPAGTDYYYRGVPGIGSVYTLSPGYMGSADVYFPLPENHLIPRSLGVTFDGVGFGGGDNFNELNIDYLARLEQY